MRPDRNQALHAFFNPDPMNIPSEPILIADGLRGIYATQFAARTIEGMIRGGKMRYNGHTVTLGAILNAASKEPGDSLQVDAWDNVVGGVFYVGDANMEHRIHEDEQGIFLVPEGYEMNAQ